MFQLVDAEKAHYPVTVLCEVLGVSRSGYYDWKRPPASGRRRTRSSPSRSRRRIPRAASGTAARAFIGPFAERASVSARRGSSV